VDRPFVYLYIALFIGASACTLFVYDNIVASLVFTTLYIFILFKTKGCKVVYISLCYLILGIISFNFYFSYDLPSSVIKSRIVANKGYYAIAEYTGRKIKVLNLNEKYELGRSYILQGDFEKVPIYEKGIIGNFTVKDSKKLDNDLIGRAYEFKRQLYDRFNERLGEYNTAILMGVCYGDSSYISYEDMEEFNILGISHVISVSGLHTSLIYSALSSFLGYQMSLILLFIYVIFTGAEAATVRAFIMIIILVLSSRIRKNYDNISALAFAAFILLLYKPYFILDVGYFLSFLGMLGIYLLYEKVRRKLYKLPTIINNSVSLTIAASALTVPYIIFIFNTFTIGGIISNIIVIPFYTFIVVIGNLALFVYKIEPIFHFLCMMLKSIFSIIQGAQDFLLNILPTPLTLSYTEGMVLVLLYPTFMLIKRGYRSLLYMPLALSVLVIISYYKIFPQISFINGGSHNIIAVSYKYKTILISPQKVKMNNIYENIKVDKIYDEFEEEEKISLDKRYLLKICRDNKELVLYLYSEKNNNIFIQDNFSENNEVKELSQKEDGKGLSYESQAEFAWNNKTYGKDENFSSTYNYPYDIIKVMKNKDIHGKGRYIKSFTIINGSAYETYIH
jgi:competence protein ComEC